MNVDQLRQAVGAGFGLIADLLLSAGIAPDDARLAVLEKMMRMGVTAATAKPSGRLPACPNAACQAKTAEMAWHPVGDDMNCCALCGTSLLRPVGREMRNEEGRMKNGAVGEERGGLRTGDSGLSGGATVENPVTHLREWLRVLEGRMGMTTDDVREALRVAIGAPFQRWRELNYLSAGLLAAQRVFPGVVSMHQVQNGRGLERVWDFPVVMRRGDQISCGERCLLPGPNVAGHLAVEAPAMNYLPEESAMPGSTRGDTLIAEGGTGE